MIEIRHDGDGEYGDEIESFDDDEYGDEGDEETDTVPCRGCGTDVYSDALQCPVCGDYVTHGGSSMETRPRWFWILGAVGVVVLIVALVVG